MAWNTASERRDLHIYYILLLVQYSSTWVCLLTSHWTVIIRYQRLRKGKAASWTTEGWYSMVWTWICRNVDTEECYYWQYNWNKGVNNIEESTIFLEAWRLERIMFSKDIYKMEDWPPFDFHYHSQHQHHNQGNVFYIQDRPGGGSQRKSSQVLRIA